jgi:hypothetical protein
MRRESDRSEFILSSRATSILVLTPDRTARMAIAVAAAYAGKGLRKRDNPEIPLR